MKHKLQSIAIVLAAYIPALLFAMPLHCDRDDVAARLQQDINPADVRTVPGDWTWRRESRVEGGAESRTKGGE